MPAPSPDRRRPLFARFYAWVSPRMDDEGMGELRDELLADVHGRVVEVGAGNGMNLRRYPPAVTEVVAVEPEPYLRRLAEETAHTAPVPVTVVPGTADSLPLRTASVDVGVVSLVLCSVPDQRAAVAELHRVIRPGGELRFLEHVVAQSAWLRRVQRTVDATVWPLVAGGCHTARDALGVIEDVGFEVTSVRRLRFPDSRVPVPAAPHVLGVARRRHASGTVSRRDRGPW
ncbi:class I SAM-dependent methyltransferase [soil metagenome]